MIQFAVGFIAALLLAYIAFLLYTRFRIGLSRKTIDVAEKRKAPAGRNFADELAHEIKNPLSVIKVNLRLVSEELAESAEQDGGHLPNQKTAKVLRKISIIEKEADRLEQTLDTFLYCADGGDMQKARIDINELLTEMIDFYSAKARSHAITIRSRLYKQPLFVNADEGMLKQVILNLFINAQEAMTGQGEIELRADRQGGTALVEISDTGRGIEQERLPRIFEQGSSRPGGRGLGLRMVRRIVEAHKGTISVQSEMGKGTSFTIKLPLLKSGDI